MALRGRTTTVAAPVADAPKRENSHESKRATEQSSNPGFATMYVFQSFPKPHHPSWTQNTNTNFGSCHLSVSLSSNIVNRSLFFLCFLRMLTSLTRRSPGRAQSGRKPIPLTRSLFNAETENPAAAAGTPPTTETLSTEPAPVSPRGSNWNRSVVPTNNKPLAGTNVPNLPNVPETEPRPGTLGTTPEDPTEQPRSLSPQRASNWRTGSGPPGAADRPMTGTGANSSFERAKMTFGGGPQTRNTLTFHGVKPLGAPPSGITLSNPINLPNIPPTVPGGSNPTLSNPANLPNLPPLNPTPTSFTPAVNPTTIHGNPIPTHPQHLTRNPSNPNAPSSQPMTIPPSQQPSSVYNPPPPSSSSGGMDPPSPSKNHPTENRSFANLTSSNPNLNLSNPPSATGWKSLSSNQSQSSKGNNISTSPLDWPHLLLVGWLLFVQLSPGFPVLKLCEPL